jgi:hypothetical protein
MVQGREAMILLYVMLDIHSFMFENDKMVCSSIMKFSIQGHMFDPIEHPLVHM